MAILKKQPKSELDQLRTQRDELGGRLAKNEQRAADLDPLGQWEELSQLTSEIQSLERAIATADKRIEAAERAAAAATVAERDAAQYERAAAARANLEAAAGRVCDELQRLDAGLLADLDAAHRELALTGGFPSPQIGPALEVRGAVRLALAAWRNVAPAWLGLPEPPSREAQALAERRADVARAEGLLDDARKAARETRHGGARVPFELLENRAFGVMGARANLLALTDPAIDGDEAFRRATDGLGNEIAAYISRYWEAREAEERAKRRDAAALEADRVGLQL